MIIILFVIIFYNLLEFSCDVIKLNLFRLNKQQNENNSKILIINIKSNNLYVKYNNSNIK